MENRVGGIAMIELRGQAVSERMKEEIERVLAQEERTPHLVIIRVGERPEDVQYEAAASRKLQAFGLRVSSRSFTADVKAEDFYAAFAQINGDAETDGILLLRPLPSHLDEKRIENSIDPRKDVDGISPHNAAGIFMGEAGGFAPCTAEAVMAMLRHYGIALRGKHAVILGRSMVVGKPLAMLLLREDATVTICHSKTENLREICRQADILVAAIGKARQIDASYVKDGAVVLDVGINVDEEGRLCGDVDFASVSKKASMLTPVPGGVGGVTVAVLGRHLLRGGK